MFGAVVASAVFLEGRTLDLGYYVSTPATKSAPVLTLFLGAAAVALAATCAAFALGLVVGFATGWLRSLPLRALSERSRGLSGGRRARSLAEGLALYALRRAADFYVELVRGTPLLVQVFFVWEAVITFTSPAWAPATQALVAGIIALTFNTGGYQAEIFRAGLGAVAPGQLEAARALGFRRFATMRHVVLPQALRLVAPPLTNEFVTLFKSSSLLSFIGLLEITMLAQSLRYIDPKIFELFLLTILLYLAVTVPASRSVGYIERRYRIPGLGLARAPREPARRTRAES